MSDHLNFKLVDQKNESDFNTIDLQKLDIDLTIKDTKLIDDLENPKINNKNILLNEDEIKNKEDNILNTLKEPVFETFVKIINLEKRHERNFYESYVCA
jgi:hypothetical protein